MVEERLPLAALLSQALVAYTIEFDNEFERRSPHRTELLGPSGGGGPWLVSMVMWFNCMRHVSETPITVSELVRRARTRTNVAGMHRWRYIDIDTTPDSTRVKPPDDELLVRATGKGRLAQEVLQPLASEIEVRWVDRFGSAEMDTLRGALRAVVSRVNVDLPDCLPIVHHGLWTAGPSRPGFSQCEEGPDDVESLALPSLLSRALLVLTVDFESRLKVSLAMHTDLLRVLGEQPTRVRDIPRLSGVSKEAVSMATGFAGKRGLTTLEANPNGGSGKGTCLTAKGLVSKEMHARLLRNVEEQWNARYGAGVTAALRTSLEALSGDLRGSRLLRGIPPFPEGWRARVHKAETLPHFPMVLHRGGYPDGS